MRGEGWRALGGRGVPGVEFSKGGERVLFVCNASAIAASRLEFESGRFGEGDAAFGSISSSLRGVLSGVVSGVTSGVVFLAKWDERGDKGGDKRKEEDRRLSCGLHGRGPVKGAGLVAAKGGVVWTIVGGFESEDSSVVMYGESRYVCISSSSAITWSVIG